MYGETRRSFRRTIRMPRPTVRPLRPASLSLARLAESLPWLQIEAIFGHANKASPGFKPQNSSNATKVHGQTSKALPVFWLCIEFDTMDRSTLDLRARKILQPARLETRTTESNTAGRRHCMNNLLTRTFFECAIFPHNYNQNTLLSQPTMYPHHPCFSITCAG